MNLHKPSAQVELTSAVCTAVAATATLCRLYVRRRARGFDDLCALLSMLFLAAQSAIILAPLGPEQEFLRSYITMSAFYATVWSARLSILLTIMRLILAAQHCRLLGYVAVIFVLFFSILVGQLFWICEPQRHHPHISSTVRRCVPNQQTAIFQLVSDVLADLTLCIASFRLFGVMQDKSMRYRFISIFSTCIGTTVVSVVHVCFVFSRSSGQKAAIASVVEASVSLIVSSLPVLSGVLYQMKDRNASSDGVTCSTHVPLSIKFATNVAALGSISNIFETTPAVSYLEQPNCTSLHPPSLSRASSSMKLDLDTESGANSDGTEGHEPQPPRFDSTTAMNDPSC